MAQRTLRAGLGLALAFGLLGMIPGAALANGLSCGDTLMADTTLTADLDCTGTSATALTIGKGSVTLNLNGHTVTGDDGEYVIDLGGRSYVVVKNGDIEVVGSGYGIFASGTNKSKLKNLTITGTDTSDGYGIELDYGLGNLITGVTTSAIYYGILLYYGANTRVLNSDLSAGSPLYVYEETGSTFSGNTLTSDDSNTDCDGDSCVVQDWYSANSRYVGNTVTGAYYGFYLYCENYGFVTINGNTASGLGYGFYLYQCGDANYRGSTAKNNVANNNDSYGFYFYCDSYGPMDIIGNTANGSGDDGFYTYECYGYYGGSYYVGGTISGNTANGNDGIGFDDYYSVNAIWTGNVANDNGDDGFYFDYPQGYVITGNIAKRNADTGFEFVDNYPYYASDDFSNNVAKKNKFGVQYCYGVSGAGNVVTNNTTRNWQLCP